MDAFCWSCLPVVGAHSVPMPTFSGTHLAIAPAGPRACLTGLDPTWDTPVQLSISKHAFLLKKKTVVSGYPSTWDAFFPSSMLTKMQPDC